MNKKSSFLSYLAVPYFDQNKFIVHERFEKVTKTAGQLLERGYKVYSPITHNHLINEQFNLNWKHKDWLDYDFLFLKQCKILFVLKLEGWKESLGVKREIEYAKKLGIKVKYIDYQR
ncbi:MAG: DUF1937 family protein [bacterium]|nr:DUF1937 family protein [bacterium]